MRLWLVVNVQSALGDGPIRSTTDAVEKEGRAEKRVPSSKRAKDRHASTRVSCERSSAQWPFLPRASAQRHRRAACCSASCSKAIASPARARSINSRSSSSDMFILLVIPLLPPKGSLARTISCESPADPCPNRGLAAQGGASYLIGRRGLKVQEYECGKKLVIREAWFGAKKRLSGRGKFQSWVISHEELQRIQREGLLPED